MLSIYADDPADLIAVNSTLATGGAMWPHAKTCTLCRKGEAVQFASC
jgi:hypothetical protein